MRRTAGVHYYLVWNFRGKPRAWRRILDLNLRDESVADSRDSLDEAGFACGVTNCLTKLFHRGVQAVFEVDESVLRPELALQLVTGDDLAGRGDQQKENFKRLAVEFKTTVEFVKGARTCVDGEIPKAH